MDLDPVLAAALQKQDLPAPSAVAGRFGPSARGSLDLQHKVDAHLLDRDEGGLLPHHDAIDVSLLGRDRTLAGRPGRQDLRVLGSQWTGRIGEAESEGNDQETQETAGGSRGHRAPDLDTTRRLRRSSSYPAAAAAAAPPPRVSACLLSRSIQPSRPAPRAPPRGSPRPRKAAGRPADTSRPARSAGSKGGCDGGRKRAA